MKVNWLPLVGNLDIQDNSISYIPYRLPTPIEVPDGIGPVTFGVTIARSNVDFQDGTISFKVLIKHPEAKCQIILNHKLGIEINVGLNIGASGYGITALKSGKWQHLDAASFGQHPPVNQWISVKVRVVGSLIELFINDVKACLASEPVHNSQLAFVLGGADGEVIVKDFSVQQSKPKAFVVMQFTDVYNELYSEVIKPTCESFGYDCVRADDVYTNKSIIEDIVNYIKESSVVIADITPDNPNVFYEVGYAHGIAKPTILLSDKKRESLPFDVSGFRTLFYENSIGGKSLIENRLKKHLEGIKSPS